MALVVTFHISIRLADWSGWKIPPSVGRKEITRNRMTPPRITVLLCLITLFFNKAHPDFRRKKTQQQEGSGSQPCRSAGTSGECDQNNSYGKGCQIEHHGSKFPPGHLVAVTEPQRQVEADRKDDRQISGERRRIENKSVRLEKRVGCRVRSV